MTPMPDPDLPDSLDLRNFLALVESVPPSSSADALAQEMGRRLGATEVRFWIADYSGRSVVATDTPVGGERVTRSAGRRPLDNGGYSEALRHQEIQVVSTRPDVRVLAPVTSRGESVGVLEMVLPTEPTVEVCSYMGAACRALAYVVAGNRQFTDSYEWGMRSTNFSLAAEIQRRLLPSAFSCEAGLATLAAWIEPAHSIGGDTFDFSVDRGELHLSVTDAVGHDLQGAMLATLLVGALRNGRRRGLGLAEQAEEADAALRAYAEESQFVTGQVVRIDLETGVASIVNAGHPLPFRLRGGELTELDLDVDLPFGLADGPYRVTRLPLDPGDRLVFVTDGMFEREAALVDLRAEIMRTADTHPRNAVHRLTAAVVDATGGEHRDDATVLCLDWHGADARSGRLR